MGFFPCAIEVAEIKKDFAKTDGISFLNTLIGKEQKTHPSLYWEFLERSVRQAVRMNQCKGVRMNMPKDPGAPIELFRLSDDLGEENNLAEQYPDVVQKINSIMNEAHQ